MTGTGTETGRGRQTYKLWAEICSEIQEFQAATFGYSRAGHTLNCLHCSFSTPAYWSCSPSCHNCNGNCTCSCSQETSSKSCRGGHPLGGEAHEAEEEEGGQPGGAHTPGLLSGRPAYLGFFNVYAHVKTYVPCSAPHLSLPSHMRNMSPSLLPALLLLCLLTLPTEVAPFWWGEQTRDCSQAEMDTELKTYRDAEIDSCLPPQVVKADPAALAGVCEVALRCWRQVVPMEDSCFTEEKFTQLCKESKGNQI